MWHLNTVSANARRYATFSPHVETVNNTLSIWYHISADINTHIKIMKLSIDDQHDNFCPGVENWIFVEKHH